VDCFFTSNLDQWLDLHKESSEIKKQLDTLFANSKFPAEVYNLTLSELFVYYQYLDWCSHDDFSSK